MMQSYVKCFLAMIQSYVKCFLAMNQSYVMMQTHLKCYLFSCYDSVICDDADTFEVLLAYS